VLGFARVIEYSPRPCYAGVGELSIYIERSARGSGLGGTLLEALTEEAERRGYWKLVGLVFPENQASVALLKGAGWVEVGLYKRHGRLDGQWRDVLLLERLLGPAAQG
jgi:L-amino acid N-acyltransferase YncA